MGFDEVTRLFRRKRSIEILQLLASETELNFNDIVEEIPSSTDTVSGTLTVLNELDLVEREQHHTNNVRYCITERGRTVLANIQEISTSIQD
jgi:DNA-binding HxlR family transcriptional regulator